MTLPALLDGKMLDLARRTVAKDCSPAEFDLFIHTCKAVRLDPLRRQIYAFVFSKDDPAKRRMSIVTGIDGYRVIADRTKCYRPDNRAPRYTIDESLIGPANPLGIVKVEVSVFKHAHGEWHEVPGEAYWDEFVPLSETGSEGFRWEETGQVYPPGHAKAGKPKYRKVPIGETVLSIAPGKDNWRKMPRIMIAKCAEAQACRRAWPDDFSGVELQEEVDRRHTLDLTATEMADQSAAEDRFARIGGKAAILVDWCNGEPLQRVPVGQFGDAVLAFVLQNREEPAAISMWEAKNTAALQEYWAHDKNGALAVKKALEASRSQLTAA